MTDPLARGALRAIVGIVDRPLDQRRDALTIDLSGGAGHVVAVGAPQSGKSTLLRSLITSLALSHTPREVQFYCLDFGGGALAGLRQLPHVGGVATRLDVNSVRRTVAEMHTLLIERERRFGEYGIDGMAGYRRAKAQGRFTDDPFGDVFLVVDGWSTIRTEFEDLEGPLADIGGRGLSYGVHLVASCTRWMDLRMAFRDLFGTRLELRLGDPSDSQLDRKTAVNVPEASPGRGITAEKLHMLTALPRIDGRQDTSDLADGVTDLVDRVRAAWSGPGAPAVRLLPAEVPYDSLPPHPDGHLTIGIAEADLRPVALDLAADPHFIVFGDSESGKSSLLRSLARRIVERYTPAEARVILIDYRRSLLGLITSEHLIGYGTSAKVTEGIVTEVSGVMKDRLPGPDVTPEQLRSRSWWKGPDLYLLIDDYDLVASTMNPLTPLIDYLSQARDIGFHVIVTRRSGGAGRALYEPFMLRMRELASPGVIMSGSKDEGALLGTVKPQPLPPGRGFLVTRKGGAQLVQLSWLPPAV